MIKKKKTKNKKTKNKNKTPTSDNERTKLEAGTTHLLTIINGYSGKEGLQEAADYMLELLKEFAASKDEELIYF